jgi:hypothetical protein
MKRSLIILFILTTVASSGNIFYIKFDQIPNYEKYQYQYEFLTDNVQFFNHWTPTWTYEANKDSLIAGLKRCYSIFSMKDSGNVEVNLLLGDISHYLYNLNEEKYYAVAENFYRKSIELAPDDYRPLWFIANHYTLANNQEKSIEYFLKAQNLLPEGEPADFWNEYALATALANMPSHSIYAMGKAKKILTEPGYLEAQLGGSIYKRILPLNSDSTYNFKNIWSTSQGNLITFVCRPLGLKLLIDSTWQISFYDYQKKQAVVTIVPPAIINKKGISITYTIALIIKVEQKGDRLDKFINNFISRYPKINELSFSDKYPEMISFELRDKNMYKEIGGGHMSMIGIKRIPPDYPGLILEEPAIIPKNGSSEISYYRATESLDRFKGNIYYAIMLDACEDIYSEAFDIFKEVFDKQIIIE